ncbi:MAG: DUF5694 domain-containing protein [Terricaulis sp.]
MKLALLATALVLVAAAPATAQQHGAFDPRAYQHQHVGQPTQVLVIGTAHLSGTPDDFDPAVLEPLLQRLQAFHPDAIAIEALPGRSISQMWQYRETYPDVAHDYGGRAMVLAALARNTLSLDMPDAEAEVRHTLATWPTAPTPEQRRRLAALFCAAGDPASALVQWWKLDASERKKDDNVSQLLVDQLTTYDTPSRKNENYLIASRLAVRLGLQRVYPMDDQSDDITSPTFAHDFEAAMSEPWFQQIVHSPQFDMMAHSDTHMRTPEETLSTYRMLNQPAMGRADSDGQWLSMLNHATLNDAGRARVAAWETRNLRMAANIREVSSNKPGGRVLVIVGSSHKPWLDAYLGMMSDVRLVDAEQVLR